MTIPAPDPQTFDWIKSALDGSMSAVMSQVIQAEKDSDPSQLTTVPGNLHQINGSLRMVELEAAGILAEDLEALCRQLCDTVVDTGLEAGADDIPGIAELRNGLEALQVYIDAIARQTPVSPLGLVDHINAVRSFTRAQPLSRFDLFHPPLTLLNADATPAVEADDDEDGPRRVPDELRVRLVTQLRRKYRRALVSWLANRKKKDGSRHYLGKINDLLNHLLRISSLDISQQLWWVAGGFVDAIASGDLDASNRIKSQFAQLDIEISRLEEENTAPIAVNPPDQLLRQMLFYIGAIEGSDSERVRKIQDDLNLNEWFDRDDSQYRKLVATSAELAAMAAAYDTSGFSDLERVLNEFFSGFTDASADAGPVTDALAPLVEAAADDGPAELVALLDQLTKAVDLTASQAADLASTQADIKIASALLFVRDSLTRPNEIDASWPQSVDSHIQELKALADPSSRDSERALRVRRIAEVEYQHARSAIAALLRDILGGLEKLLGTGDSSSGESDQELPADLLNDAVIATRQVSSVLQVADNELAGSVAAKLADVLEMHSVSRETPAGENLEHLAFAVAALGVSADHLSRRGPEADNVLRAALDRLSDLKTASAPLGSAGQSQRAETAQTDDGQTTDIADEEPQEIEVDAGAEGERTASVEFDDEDAEVAEFDSVAALISALDYQRRQLNSGSHDGLRGLMETFEALSVADDADEPTARLSQMGQSICNNLLEKEAGLDTERRDFLGLLIRQLRDVNENADTADDSNQAAGVDVDAWQRRLHALTETANADPDSGLLQLDADLRSIFVEEFGAHLNRLRNALNDYRQLESDAEPARQAIRDIDDCVHTLSGNCRNLGFDDAADCAETAALGLLNNRAPSGCHEAMAQFAEALILLGQVRQEVRQGGVISDQTNESLRAYVARFSSANSSDTAADAEKVSPEAETGTDEDVAASVTVDIADTPAAPVTSDSEIAVLPEESIDEDIDEEIREIFLEESESILGRINEQLMNWRSGGPDVSVLSGMRREFHTLKGSAAATGFTEISELSHRVETLLEEQTLEQSSEAEQSDGDQRHDLLELMEEMHDGLAADLGIMPTDAKGHLPALNRKLDGLNEEADPTEIQRDERNEPAVSDVTIIEAVAEEQLTDEQPADADSADEEPADEKPADEQPAVDSLHSLAEPVTDLDGPVADARDSWMPEIDQSVGQSRGTDDAAPGSMLRIGNTKLAELINASGELGLVRTQLQDTLDATRMDLDVLRSSMSSMRSGLRDLELEADAQMRARPEQQSVSLEDDFDPLQLDRYSRLQSKSREVTDLLDQLSKVERDLDNRAANLDGALRQQLHLGDQLQSGLMSARMVSMGDYLPRLRYLVRESSRQAEKKVDFRFQGGDIQVDRQVIEAMMAPFEHMIRNSVAHGIETPEKRSQKGKSETGAITLSLVQQGSELVVGFGDDGAGLNLDKLNARAVELGLVDDAAVVTDTDLLQVITQPGYSTAESVTMESGRGVGMDVVYQAVRDLGGSMTLDNRAGQGTTFQFRLPVTLALTQALLVRVAGWRFAVRSRTIERLTRVNRDEIYEQDGDRLITVDDQPVVLYSVRERLGEPENPEKREFLSVVLVRLADRLAAFEVDQFGDSVNIVSKPSGRQLASIPEISGVTVLGDSSIVLILDPEAFVDRIAPLGVDHVDEDQSSLRTGQLRRVLVVDDSLVVRKVMQKDLEADGLEVETAIDGVNALEILENSSVDIALVDIEMPRMNGYELLERLRADPRYQTLPVIIITSRSGDQHRQRALALGADGYITKPYDITVLDGLMRDVVANRQVLH